MYKVTPVAVVNKLKRILANIGCPINLNDIVNSPSLLSLPPYSKLKLNLSSVGTSISPMTIPLVSKISAKN